MLTAPVKPALVLDVGLAHGKECFEIAEKGHICRGYEADPESAALVQRQAATHAQAHLLQIHAAAVGARNTHAVFKADRSPFSRLEDDCAADCVPVLSHEQAQSAWRWRAHADRG